MYEARGNEVYYVSPDGKDELFLTVHPTTSDKTPEEQAIIIAKILNNI